MPHRKIDFANKEWIDDQPGFRYKERRIGSHKMRLVEVTDGYVDTDWCMHQHTGYVVEGRIRFIFPDKEIEFQAGDGIVITDAPNQKHKAVVPQGGKVLLVFFEPN